MQNRLFTSSIFYLLAGLFLTVFGILYFLFIWISGLYYYDISMTYVPIILPIYIGMLVLGCVLLFYFLKRSKRFEALFSSTSTVFLLAYAAPLLLAFIFGMHGNPIGLSFIWSYVSAASACFVTFGNSFFGKRFEGVQNQPDSDAVLEKCRLSFLQFVLMAIVFTSIGVLLAAFWQWRGFEFGRMRPLFAHDTARTIWVQLPVYLFFLGMFVWWPLFSVIRRILHDFQYVTISFLTAVISFLLLSGWKGVINLPDMILTQSGLWQINVALVGACLVTAFLFRFLLFRTEKVE